MKQWAGIVSNLSFLWNFSVLGVPTALSKYHRKISLSGYRALGCYDFLCDLQWHLLFIELERLHSESHHNLPPLRQLEYFPFLFIRTLEFPSFLFWTCLRLDAVCFPDLYSLLRELIEFSGLEVFSPGYQDEWR